MKKETHPQIFEVEITCTCGKQFKTVSTSKDLRSTLCSNCHPFYTGEHRNVDSAGRIEKFNMKYKKSVGSTDKNKKQSK